MEGNQENQIIPGETFAFRPAKNQSKYRAYYQPCCNQTHQDESWDHAWLADVPVMLEVAGAHVVLCYSTKTHQPSRLERMKTLTSASVVERGERPLEKTLASLQGIQKHRGTAGRHHSSGWEKEIENLNLIARVVCQNVVAGGHLHWTAGQTDMLEIFIKTPGISPATCSAPSPRR